MEVRVKNQFNTVHRGREHLGSEWNAMAVAIGRRARNPPRTREGGGREREGARISRENLEGVKVS